MKTKILLIKISTLILLLFVHSTGLFSQSYSLDDPLFVPLYNLDSSVDDMDYRDYFWDINEINNVNNRQDIAVGLNQILNSTPRNYIDANWYYNQYDDNFNIYNSSTKFIHQQGYQIDLREISGLIFSKINSTSGKKDIVVSQGDTMYVFKNVSGSISTSDVQHFNFGCVIHSTGRFTTDDVEDICVRRNDSIFIFKGKGTESKLDSIPVFKMGGAAGSNVKFILAQVNNQTDLTQS